jgi:hypothetical protein
VSVTEGRRRLIVDLLAEQVLADARLIGRIIDIVFDELAHMTVEVRIREQRLEITP